MTSEVVRLSRLSDTEQAALWSEMFGEWSFRTGGLRYTWQEPPQAQASGYTVEQLRDLQRARSMDPMDFVRQYGG